MVSECLYMPCQVWWHFFSGPIRDTQTCWFSCCAYEYLFNMFCCSRCWNSRMVAFTLEWAQTMFLCNNILGHFLIGISIARKSCYRGPTKVFSALSNLLYLNWYELYERWKPQITGVSCVSRPGFPGAARRGEERVAPSQPPVNSVGWSWWGLVVCPLSGDVQPWQCWVQAAPCRSVRPRCSPPAPADRAISPCPPACYVSL